MSALLLKRRSVVKMPSVVMCQSLHFALQEKQRPFSASDTMKPATDLPNGDPQHLREMARFAQPKLSTVVGRIIDRLAHPRC